MQSLNTTNKYKTSKEISICNKNAPFTPPKLWKYIVIVVANNSI